MRGFRLLLFGLLFGGWSLAAPAAVKLSVAYSRPADLFSMMDNVSGWLDGFVIPDYRREWQRRFGWSAADQAWADRYAEYRRRTFIDDAEQIDPLASDDGIFASRSENTAGADPLATYFLDQSDVSGALSHLGRFASPADARMLGGFYHHFESGWRVLLGESAPLIEKARRLQSRLDRRGVASFVERVGTFYGADAGGAFTIYFTRHPPGRHTSAEPVAGRYMLLHSPALENGDDSYWDTIVMHELVHYISSRQSVQQKRELTRRFLARCPLPDRAKRLWLIEEPLAVAWGQAAYSAIVLHTPRSPAENWYAIPWVNIVSRAIAPSVTRAYATDATIKGAILDEVADRCQDLTAVATQLALRKP